MNSSWARNGILLRHYAAEGELVRLKNVVDGLRKSHNNERISQLLNECGMIERVCFSLNGEPQGQFECGITGVFVTSEGGYDSALNKFKIVRNSAGIGGKYGQCKRDASPLHFAIVEGHWDMVEFLIENGARKDKQAACGASSSDMAEINGTIKYLLRSKPYPLSQKPKYKSTVNLYPQQRQIVRRPRPPSDSSSDDMFSNSSLDRTWDPPKEASRAPLEVRKNLSFGRFGYGPSKTDFDDLAEDILSSGTEDFNPIGKTIYEPEYEVKLREQKLARKSSQTALTKRRLQRHASNSSEMNEKTKTRFRMQRVIDSQSSIRKAETLARESRRRHTEVRSTKGVLSWYVKPKSTLNRHSSAPTMSVSEAPKVAAATPFTRRPVVHNEDHWESWLHKSSSNLQRTMRRLRASLSS